jgi:hypothetical protein
MQVAAVLATSVSDSAPVDFTAYARSLSFLIYLLFHDGIVDDDTSRSALRMRVTMTPLALMRLGCRSHFDSRARAAFAAYDANNRGVCSASASALVTFIRVFCSLRTQMYFTHHSRHLHFQISQSICNFTQ